MKILVLESHKVNGCRSLNVSLADLPDEAVIRHYGFSFDQIMKDARTAEIVALLHNGCGPASIIEPFEDTRTKFDVRYYLVAILFIIFDLEIAFLFPWAAAFGSLSAVAFWSMIVFLGVLTIGFAYEWKKGALEWS
mgnify:CR=1 FL=1